MKMLAKPRHLWYFEKTYETTTSVLEGVFEIDGFQWNVEYFRSSYDDWNYLLQIKFIRDSVTPYLDKT